MWDALREITTRQGISVHDLVTKIDRDRAFNLSTAICVYIVEFYRARTNPAKQSQLTVGSDTPEGIRPDTRLSVVSLVMV